jgi:hypothetical protein
VARHNPAGKKPRMITETAAEDRKEEAAVRKAGGGKKSGKLPAALAAHEFGKK